MARTELANINHCVTPTITSRKDSTQRHDEIKTEFTAREGTYKISSFIDTLGRPASNTCLNEPVKITLRSRIQTIVDDGNSQNSSRRSSTTNHHHQMEQNSSTVSNGTRGNVDVLTFNVGRELLIYEFTEATQSNFGEPIDHRVYKQNHQPTCHDLTQDPHTNILHILVGFSKGQIQYINMQSKEQKVFNEGSYLDKSKVTCIKWLSTPRTYFIASYSSGCLYVYDEQLNHQRDTNIQPSYSTIKDNEKNYSVSYTKNTTKQNKNPIARWSIGSGSINEFAFSPDQHLLAVVSQDGFLRIFDYDKMELISYMKSYFGGLLCVCWSPDGKYIATGGEDDFLTLFSLDSNEEKPRVICRGHGHTSWISAISFDPSMNAKSYYSSSSFTHDNEQNNSRSNRSSRMIDTMIPSIFYRIGTVGQDNRLCLWDITEDLLKMNVNNSKKSPLISSPSTNNGHSSIVPDILPSNPIAPSKSSFSSLTSRLSFVRNSNKVNKSLDETSDLASTNLSNGSNKKSRKLSTGSKSSSGKLTTMDEINHDSLSTLTTTNTSSSSSSSSRRTNFDLTRNTFGTNLCPKLDEIQVIEPILSELIAHERLNGIYFGENYFLTSSQDGIITVWEKPQKLLPTTTDDQTTF